MGLDMYWFAGKTREEKAQAVLKNEDPEARKEIGYFRKFHDLNEFMGSLYPVDTLDEVSGDFNCVELELDYDLLEQMRNFGDDHEFVSSNEADEFIKLCDAIREHLDAKRPVIYWPWW